MAYEPRPVPTELRELITFLTEELQLVADGINEVELIQLPQLHNEPERVRDGMIVFADGSDWEPVSSGGEGYYGYYNSQWNKLG